MATEEHKRLAAIIKNCHQSLRQLYKQHGAQRCWEEHLKDRDLLREYAEAMRQLASIWESNDTKADDQQVRSRIRWTIDYCTAYFYTERIYITKRQREQRLLEMWPDSNTDQCCYLESAPDVLRILDVGSCFNPFASAPHFAVTAIDLCPAGAGVLRGDFLRITVEDSTGESPAFPIAEEDGEVCRLPSGYFECVVFSLLLEYIPDSDQRIECCRKAYKLLRPEGVLVIITPDSQHVGKNAALMKNWRYTLATLGFSRIRFEKLQHITCLAFRKASDPRVAHRWAQEHHEDYMTLALEIPQDTK